MRVPPNIKFWVCLGLLGALPAARSPGAESDAVAGKDHPAPASLVVLTPGTQVPGPQNLPPGWTHLVIKSVPRLASGDLASLPAVARPTATLFRTVLLAEVRRSGGAGTPFLLRRLGLGLCTPVKGVDTVVSSATVDALHVPLGFLDRFVLRKAEEELMRGRIKARTPTFALYSAPALQKRNAGHESVVLRYAVVVDSRTGSLHALLWSQASEALRRAAPDRLVLLPPGLVNDTAVDVLAERVLSALPVNWTFALAALPTGKPLQATPAIRQWSLHDKLTPAESASFETDLRKLLERAGAGRGPAPERS